MADSRTPGRFRTLLAILVALLVAHPLLIEAGLDGVFRLAFALAMIVLCWTVSRQRSTTMLAVALAVPAGIAQVAAWSAPGRLSMVFAATLTALLLTLVLVVVLRAVLAPGPVTGDRIAGAVCVYLLLGMVWAMFHTLLWTLQPTAYDFGASTTVSTQQFFYFSFVTLTTLGYGDITPASPLAQTLSWTEAAAGQLFVAITLARLVGLYISSAHIAPSESSDDTPD